MSMPFLCIQNPWKKLDISLPNAALHIHQIPQKSIQTIFSNLQSSFVSIVAESHALTELPSPWRCPELRSLAILFLPVVPLDRSSCFALLRSTELSIRLPFHLLLSDGVHTDLVLPVPHYGGKGSRRKGKRNESGNYSFWDRLQLR